MRRPARAVGPLVVPDALVPDAAVAAEFDVTLMTIYRWTKDETLGFPPPLKIRTRNYRSRRALDEFKERMFQRGVTNVA